MVTRKELSDFKQTLTTALQRAGYTAYGRISSSEETYNTYAPFPEQEMVSMYVEDNNLDEINRVYRVIKYIDDNSGNTYSLKKLCQDHDIDYRVFTHVVDNMPYIDKTGERRSTQYHWIHEEQPSFASAKDIVDHMRKLKSTKLNKTLKKKISRAVAEGVSKDEFFKTNNIKKEATFSADTFYNYQKVQQQKKSISETIAEPETDNILEQETQAAAPEHEIHPVTPEQEIQDQVSVSEEPAVKDDESQQQPEIIDDAGLQMENYILKQEIKYLRKINKAKDKLIKALRRKA